MRYIITLIAFGVLLIAAGCEHINFEVDWQPLIESFFTK